MNEEQQFFEKIKDLLTAVIGEDFMEEYDVEMESTLTGDLEMESIEIVELSEKIKAHYGKDIGINEWMAQMNLEQLINLSVGDMVKFLVECKQLN